MKLMRSRVTVATKCLCFHIARTAGYYVKGAQLLAAKPDFMCAPCCDLWQIYAAMYCLKRIAC